MNRCLELAAAGFGKTAPNPMVGCVIVHNDIIIGEGYHHQFGGAHAEVNAMESVKDKSLLKDSILYVNLEPCSHFGKTPPCSDDIIRNKIRYVVVGGLDPNPLISGKGIHKLAASGCDVKVGVLESECRGLNRRFFTFHEKKRPYIILKWAQTADRYMGVQGSRLQVSGSEAAKLVHQWRSEEQAIMVGTATALTDNPQLTARGVNGKNPLRIFIDRNLRVPSHYHLLDGSTPTLVFTTKPQAPGKDIEYAVLNFEKDIVEQMMEVLHQKEIQSVIVEGGPKLLNAFISKGLWDEARTLTGKKKLAELAPSGEGVPSPLVAGKVVDQQELRSDIVLVLRNIS